MQETYSICGYTRISVDLEEGRDNTSIENQKAIIEEFVRQKFPGSSLDLYVDRDRSGYTFEQREDYQKMRKLMMKNQYDILIVKDLSRFSRRNSYGLVELETLRDAGIRIISIGDNIDYPTNEDWMRIQIYFFMNEMPVTDTSKKVKSVINRRQKDGKWICAVPYGYRLLSGKSGAFEVDEPAAEVVRKIFELYNDGWGYKRISNWLTDEGIPTPRMRENAYRQSRGEDVKREAKTAWSIVSVQGILDNDFYIGTLRQRKHTRKKINGKDVKLDELDQIVFENHHTPIVDMQTFALTRQIRHDRKEQNYNGGRKYINPYSGLLRCGDCGAPMFSLSRPDLPGTYVCGSYHRRGLKGCNAHYTKIACLDAAVKHAIRQVRDNADGMIEHLQKAILDEEKRLTQVPTASDSLEEQLGNLTAELKAVKSQKLRDCVRHPENREVIEETYDSLEADLTSQIESTKNQLRLCIDAKQTLKQITNTARTVIEVFDRILAAEHLSHKDLTFVVERITVYSDSIEVALKSDVQKLLCSGVCKTDEIDESATVIQASAKHPSKELKLLIECENEPKNSDFAVNGFSNGDPLEIFTDREGEVILKKYSPIGELGDFAKEYAESLQLALGMTAAVCDKDTVIAASGPCRKELIDKPIHSDLEELMDRRGRLCVGADGGTAPHITADEAQPFAAAAIATIICAGDPIGAVMLLSRDENASIGRAEQKATETAANFLGKQMEG